MTPYFDVRFLLTMLVKTRGTTLAWELAHRFDAPLLLNPLHRLQVENALTRQLYDKPRLRLAARQGLAEWRNKIAEAVFGFSGPDWELAFRQAAIGMPNIPKNLRTACFCFMSRWRP